MLIWKSIGSRRISIVRAWRTERRQRRRRRQRAWANYSARKRERERNWGIEWERVKRSPTVECCASLHASYRWQLAPSANQVRRPSFSAILLKYSLRFSVEPISINQSSLNSTKNQLNWLTREGGGGGGGSGGGGGEGRVGEDKVVVWNFSFSLSLSEIFSFHFFFIILQFLLFNIKKFR